MHKKTLLPALSFGGTAVLKAIAILAVISIHTLSSIQPSPFVNSSPFQLLAVSIDQLSRISVPLFVALSGYGLAYSYSKKPFAFFDFFKRRVLKILPLYVIWSAIFALLFYFIPAWAPAIKQPNFAWQLVLGRADYHLYFVPMIFQLYLFFPILFVFFKKWPTATVLLALITQLVWWWFFNYQGLTVTSWKYFAGDNEQYLWMTNWIGYFVFGMYLPTIWKLLDKNKPILGLTTLLFFGSFFYTVTDALQAIQNGIDPLFALKFTRYPVFLYSVFAIVIASFLVVIIKNDHKSLIKIGENSYLIYLSHTLCLRVIFWFLYR